MNDRLRRFHLNALFVGVLRFCNRNRQNRQVYALKKKKSREKNTRVWRTKTYRLHGYKYRKHYSHTHYSRNRLGFRMVTRFHGREKTRVNTIRDVVGYEGLYTVSDDGYVFNADGLELIQQIRKEYCILTLCKNGMRKTCLVHRLVAESFCPRLSGQSQVHHIDGNSFNNRASNLIWCNDAEHGKIHSGLEYTAIKSTNIFSGKVCYLPYMSSLQFYGLSQKSVLRAIKNGKTYQQCRWELYNGPIDTPTIPD